MTVFADLERMVRPRAIAVVGASSRPGSQGWRLFENLSQHSAPDLRLFAVNPAYDMIGDQPCWPSIRDLPSEQIDVALIMINASMVLDALRACVEKGIPYAVVMTSGFAEAGPAGQALEAEVARLCRDTGLRVYGPNCPGFVNIRDRIGMTFSPAFKNDLNAGRIGLATQGGGLGRNLLQGLAHGAGAGVWFSAGNEVDLELPDFIAYMARDPDTAVIGILMEGVKNGRRLANALALARQHGKPVVVLKVGRSAYGIEAAQSHTASLAGTPEVNSAIFRQFGAIEVDDLDELLAVTRMLATSPPAVAPGLAVFTFSGGTAALAADLIGVHGLTLAALGSGTLAALRARLPAFAAITNPVDTTADILRDPGLIRQCLEIVCADPAVGSVLFPIPMDYGDITATMAQAMIDVAGLGGARIVPVWMSRRLGSGFQLLEQQGLAPFPSLSSAIAALAKVTPRQAAPSAGAHAPRDAAATPARTALSESAAKQLLSKAGIMVPRGETACNATQAAEIGERVGFPVAMKIVSAQILHKTEVGGVRLNVGSPEAAHEAYEALVANAARARPDAVLDGVLVEKMYTAKGREMLIGVHRDPAFGAVMTLALGGIFVEMLKDATHRLIPISHDDALAMVGELKHSEILRGYRGAPPADIDALADLLLRVSDFVSTHPNIAEADFNPVWVGPAGQGAVPLDALILLDEPIAATPSLLQGTPS